MASVKEQVAHIWRRMGFGPAPGDIEAGVAIGPTALIDDLLGRPLTTENQWGWPASVETWEQRTQLHDRMIDFARTSPNPLQERMHWILEGLLVIAEGNAAYKHLRDHFRRLRLGAFGSYKQLLHDVAESDGMQRYLNGTESEREHPNENLARELMELFSLGVKHPKTGSTNYSETDVKEVARALTGYRYKWPEEYVYWDENEWDPGNKTFLGAPRGAAKLNEVIDAIAGHASFRYFVPKRLYLELVGLNPDAATLDSLANLFSSTGELWPVVRAIVKSPVFLSDAAIRARVKQPIELVLSSHRALGANFVNFDPWWPLHELQQDRFAPPNVNGWPQGGAWLNAGHLIQWSGYARQLSFRDNPWQPGPPEEQSAVMRDLYQRGSTSTGGALALELANLFDVSAQTRKAVADYAAGGTWNFPRACGTMNLVLVSPEFMLS